jgi:hypothetical protein
MRNHRIPVAWRILAIITLLILGVSLDRAQAPGRQDAIDRMVKQAEFMKMRAEQAARHSAAKALDKTSPADMPMPGGEPNYYGPEPNWANSPIIRKFVDSLPGLNAGNNLGQMIPVAVPDTITFPGSDYYEIAVREYAEKLHSDLPTTKLRGYVQLNKGTSGGQNTVNPAPIHYLGPMIMAQRDRPVRLKFVNQLPTGSAGNQFLPTDTTVMGAGMGPDGTMYTQNRTNLHLHGGATPWISDGTPHQWITPAGETTNFKKGVSLQNVPDMWYNAAGNVVPAGTPGATNDPGPGASTYYYTNQAMF